MLLTMEGQGEEEIENEGMEEQAEQSEGNGGEISMCALQGCASGRVLNVKGIMGKRKLVVLINSDRTHSFLDKETATILQCEIWERPPLSMLIANRSRMVSQYKCKEF